MQPPPISIRTITRHVGVKRLTWSIVPLCVYYCAREETVRAGVASVAIGRRLVNLVGLYKGNGGLGKVECLA